MNISYNLSEISLYYPFGTELEQHLADTRCDRFYLGSYLCSNYCLKSINMFLWRALPFIRENGFHITLAIPATTGRENTFLKQNIAQCLFQCGDCLDELVVNDDDMLEYVLALREQYPVKITAGRLFTQHFSHSYYGDGRTENFPVVLAPILEGRISAIEVDLISERMDLSGVPADIELHAHYPHIYVTNGLNSELAAPLQQKLPCLRGQHCGLSCMREHMETKAVGRKVLLLGKGVYIESLQPSYIGRKPDRYIYWPARDFL